MRPKMASLFIVLAVTSACAAPGDQIAQPIQTEVTETADGGVSLPPTWTPTITLTDSPTPSATLTSTITPIRSITPTRTITAIPSITPTWDLTANPIPTESLKQRLSSATLRLTDLPQGYSEDPYGDSYLDMSLYEDQTLEVLAVSAFTNEPAGIVVMSMTYAFASQADIDDFDQSLNEMIEMIEEDYLETEADPTTIVELMEDIQPIGNNSIAIHMEMEAGGESFTYEILMFRRSFVGAMVMMMDMQGDEELPSLEKLGIILDVRIVEAFQ